MSVTGTAPRIPPRPVSAPARGERSGAPARRGSLDSLSSELIAELPSAPARRAEPSEAPRNEPPSETPSTPVTNFTTSKAVRVAGAVLLVGLLAMTGARRRGASSSAAPKSAPQAPNPTQHMNNYERFIASIPREELL